MDKKQLRKQVIQERELLDINEKKNWDKSIYESVIKLIEERSPKGIFIFVSFKSEVDTIEIIKFLFNKGIEVFVPKIVHRKMITVKINSLDDLTKGTMGILEPISSEELQGFDLILVPGVVFGRKGYRIGYGGGYYDRFICKNKDINRIAIGYHMQLIEEVPRDSWDKKLHMLITEKEVLNFNI